MTSKTRLALIAAAALLTSGASYAQFGGLLNSIKNKVEQAQKQLAPASAPAAAPGAPAMPAVPGMPGTAPTIPAMPAVATAAATSDIRQKWLNDPYPEIPQEVTDQDIQAVTVASINKIFVYLNSPVMAKAYKQCQTVEEARVGARGAELRQASNAAKTNSEKNQLLEQAQAVDSLKAKISPSTCLMRVVRRATFDLNLEFYGTQPKYGGPKGADEQFNVVQVFKVARALEKNEFTSAFHTAMADEISINFNDWIDKYLTKMYKANAEELKKMVPANDRKSREQFDAGADFAVARRVEIYNQIVNSIANWIATGAVKP